MKYLNYIWSIVVGASIGFLILLAAGNFKTEEQKRIEMIEKVLPQTVMIEVETVVPEISIQITKKGMELTRSTATKIISGSGVVVSSDKVLTCNHLFNIGKVKHINVLFYNGIVETSTVAAFSKENDLALLNIIKAHRRIATLENVYNQKVGQTAIAVGYALGNPWSVSHGIVSALNNDQFGYNLTQSDTFINPGNSGGPLFNSDGKLIGINRMILSSVNPVVFSGCGYATSLNQVTEFLIKCHVKFKR